MERRKRVGITALGCKVNQYEAEAMGELFEAAGYERVNFSEPADVYLIHTCTVTHLADRKARNLIRRAGRRNPEAILAVSGCYPQVYPEEIRAIPGVDLILGTRNRSKVVGLVERARESEGVLDCIGEFEPGCGFEPLAAATHPGRSRPTVKIQEGCEEHCIYCIVPRARGPLRSRPREEVVLEARRLVRAGFRELVLTGVNLGAYGRDLGPGEDLAGLVGRLHSEADPARIRLSSVEPMYLTPELMEAVATLPRVCSHLHLPLQHGDDRILSRMGRDYTAGQFLRMVERMRELDPGIGVTTDVMVGFPGETEAHFKRLVEFVRRVGFSRMHVFKFSPRPGTPAARLPERIDPEVAGERSRILRRLSGELALAFHSRFLGRELEVLVEGKEDGADGELTGLSGNYIRVRLPAADGLENRLVRVRVEGATPDHVRVSPVSR